MKSLGDKMSMFWKGSRTSKSGSPVMIQSALPDKASSKYLLSFGSRQTNTWWIGIIHLIKLVYLEMASSRMSIGLKYLSNFGFRIRLENSSIVAADANKVWNVSAFLSAWAATPLGVSDALITMLQSITSRIYSSLSNSFSLSSVIPCCCACSAENSSKSLSDFEEDVTRSTQILRSISRFSLFTRLSFSARLSSNSRVMVFMKQIY
jgi:hypothetical protein